MRRVRGMDLHYPTARRVSIVRTPFRLSRSDRVKVAVGFSPRNSARDSAASRSDA